jgi:hypothetical protein
VTFRYIYFAIFSCGRKSETAVANARIFDIVFRATGMGAAGYAKPNNAHTVNIKIMPCAGYFAHPFVHSAFKKSSHGVLPFHEEECILLMSAEPRENLPSWQRENFCQDAQKEQVKTFVTRA